MDVGLEEVVKRMWGEEGGDLKDEFVGERGQGHALEMRLSLSETMAIALLKGWFGWHRRLLGCAIELK